MMKASTLYWTFGDLPSGVAWEAAIQGVERGRLRSSSRGSSCGSDRFLGLGLTAALALPTGALCLNFSLACVGCFTVALWDGLPMSACFKLSTLDFSSGACEILVVEAVTCNLLGVPVALSLPPSSLPSRWLPWKRSPTRAPG